MQNLILNILTFNPPIKEKEFSFIKERKEGFFPIKKHEFPVNIADVIPEKDLENQNYLYTDFATSPENSFLLNVNLEESKDFAQHYYSLLIHNHFINIADVVQFDFINDLLVWFRNDKINDPKFTHYHIFRLRVQVGRVSKFPELVIAYVTHTRVYKKNIQQLGYSLELYTRTIYNKQIIKYKKLSDTARNDLQNVYAVLNNKLKKKEKIVDIPDVKKNCYKEFYELVNQVYDKYINSDEFKKIIPLNCNNFIKVDNSKVFHVSKASNYLLFANKKSHFSAKFGIKSGVFQFPSNDRQPGIFFICHKDHEKQAVILEQFFSGRNPVFNNDVSFDKDEKGNPIYKGLSEYIGTPMLNYEFKKIIFSDISDPLKDIIPQIEKKNFDVSKKRYVAIYISPISKNNSEEDALKVYYQLKEKLLYHGVSSQVIDVNKIGGYGFEYRLQNIMVAICAKLDGIPWRLQTPIQSELIIGVGAFKSRKFNTRYVGSAFCFSNNGHFKGFDAMTEQSIDKLADSIITAVKQFKKDNDGIKRLVIHFYKTMSKKDIDPIYKLLQTIDKDIAIIIVTINKTESTDYLFFDDNFVDVIPESGTYLSIGTNKFLLCNNTRYDDDLKFKIESYPFPIKLSFWATNKEILDYNTISQLINQIYQFSRIYWKQVKQQSLPVTIRYPEMVAEIFPHFNVHKLPQFGKNNLWFI